MQTEQQIINHKIAELANKYEMQLVATTDVHYLRPEDKKLHEVFLNSRQDKERELGNFYDYTYLMTKNEMLEILSSQLGEKLANQAIENTNLVAEKVELYELESSPILPEVKVPELKFQGIFDEYMDKFEYIKKFYESDSQADRFWLWMIEEGHSKNLEFDREKYSDIKYIERINRELEIKWHVSDQIGRKVSQYYAGMADDMNTIRDCNSLIGAGRGSICGFYTAYTANITQIDPLDYNIPEWRHLDEERPELPDIDIDVEPQLINTIFKKLQEKHGEKRVIKAGTFKSVTSKSAILMSERGLRKEEYPITYEMAQKISSLIPVDRGKNWTIKQCIYGDSKKGYQPVEEIKNYAEEYPKLFEYAQKLEGLIVDRSKHASAVYIYDDDYTKYNAAMKTAGGIVVTQLNMKDSDFRGGTKYDFLVTEQQTLKHLTLDKIIPGDANINDKYNQLLHPRVLNLDDENVYKNIFHQGKTKTVFQWNSQIGIDALKTLLPNNLTELSVGNNAIRLIGDAIKKYVRYKNDITLFDADYDYLTEKERLLIKRVLKDSYCVAITQEDMMRLSIEIGFSRKLANKLRKGVAKKKPEEIKKSRVNLYKIGRKEGFRPLFLYTIWYDFIKPLEGYAFSTNHSFPYSLEGYQDAFLFNYYPLEWCSSYLSVASQAFSEDSKSSDYGKLATAIAVMKTEGFPTYNPKINHSKRVFEVVDGKIIYGLKGLSNVGDWAVEQIVRNRPYTSFKDFIEKNVLMVNKVEQVLQSDNGKTTVCLVNDDKKFEKRIVFSLIGSGCFDDLHPDKTRRDLFIEYIKLTYKYMKSIDVRHYNELCELKLAPLNLQKEEAREYIKEHKEYLVEQLNRHRMNALWKEMRQGIIKGEESDWEFNAMNYYVKKHAMNIYSRILDDYNKMPEEANFTPASFVDRKTGETIEYKRYDISRIGGTLLDKEDKDGKITILTPTGVVIVRMYGSDWDKYRHLFDRGNKFIIHGYRRRNTFIPKIYRGKGVRLDSIMLLEDYLKRTNKNKRR